MTDEMYHGHCWGCGNPGDYCTCTKACRCAALHKVGSARDPDALTRFTDAPVSDDQLGLFE